MKLADLRKLSIKQQVRIHFRLQNGMECIVTEHGVAQIPELKGIPDFNLEQELVSTQQFLLEPLQPAGRKGPAPSRSIGREELAQMTATGPAPAHDDHDDE